jgi:hypothetical protein
MDQAEKDLQRKKGEEAAEKQQEAIEDLEQAKADVEERLRQLREEMQEEMLAALEARFRAMLDKQKPITADTASLHRQRLEGRSDDQGPRPLTRAEQILVGDLAARERSLAGMAAKALTIIREDGTTVVFPRIVEQLDEDLRSVADLLGEPRTGAYTQSLQQEIEATLEELIAALEKAQKQSGQGQGQGQQGDPENPPMPPLVPESAELKLLKSAQLRVNRQTTALDRAVDEQPATSQPMTREAGRLADRQEEVREMAEDMVAP